MATSGCPKKKKNHKQNNYIPIFELFYTILEKKIKLLLFTVSEMLIDILEEKSINVTVRRKLGSDIDASCGQLRLRKIKEPEIP